MKGVYYQRGPRLVLTASAVQGPRFGATLLETWRVGIWRLRGHGFALTMDLRHDHGALIHVVRACDNADAPNLIAIGGENSVSVLLIVCAATFFVS